MSKIQQLLHRLPQGDRVLINDKLKELKQQLAEKDKEIEILRLKTNLLRRLANQNQNQKAIEELECIRKYIYEKRVLNPEDSNDFIRIIDNRIKEYGGKNEI